MTPGQYHRIMLRLAAARNFLQEAAEALREPDGDGQNLRHACAEELDLAAGMITHWLNNKEAHGLAKNSVAGA